MSDKICTINYANTDFQSFKSSGQLILKIN